MYYYVGNGVVWKPAASNHSTDNSQRGLKQWRIAHSSPIQKFNHGETRWLVLKPRKLSECASPSHHRYDWFADDITHCFHCCICFSENRLFPIRFWNEMIDYIWGSVRSLIVVFVFRKIGYCQSDFETKWSVMYASQSDLLIHNWKRGSLDKASWSTGKCDQSILTQFPCFTWPVVLSYAELVVRDLPYCEMLVFMKP